jgi:CBS domain-containing protein
MGEIAVATLVRHVMTPEPRTASADMNAYDAAGIMATNDVGFVPIVEGDVLRGLVTDRDLVTRVLAAREDPLSVQLGDIVTERNLVTVTPDTELSEARKLMAEHQIRRLPVVKDERLLGVISLGDVAVAFSSERAVGETIREISESVATTDVQHEGPGSGTPERVREARGEDG